MPVVDPTPRQLPAQGFAVELRRVARPRDGADVDQQIDLGTAQCFDELIERAGGVPDRVQPHDRRHFTGHRRNVLSMPRPFRLSEDFSRVGKGFVQRTVHPS